METLVPAFIAALLTQLGDRPAMLAAILADRYGRPLLVALAAGLAHGLGNAVAAIAGAAVAPMLTLNAQALMLAIALLLGGFGLLWPVKQPDRHEGWRMGSLLTAFLGIFALALGDRTQFFTFALATRGQPVFALAGAVAGCFAVTFVAAVLGELVWARVPFRIFRAITGVGMLVAALWIGSWALRLV